ncbi:MAG: radical SAM protein [Chloroflexota bacterium]
MWRVKNLLNLASDSLHSLPLLILYLTDGCNSRCVSCDIWQNPRRNMPISLVDSLLETVPELGIRYVLLSGGEAMQHPEWDTIAKKFRAAGVHVMLLTNGLLLRKQIDRVCNAVDEVIVSLDGGAAETYEAIRGVDAFQLLLEGMQQVVAAGIPVTTRTTVQAENYHEMPLIVDVALANGASTVSFLPVDVSNPEAFGDRDLMINKNTVSPLAVQDTTALANIIDKMTVTHADAFSSGRIAESPDKLHRILTTYFRALQGESAFEPPPCNAPHFSTVVEVDGRVRPCYFLPTYGRLRPDGERLPQAINWDAARDLRRAYRAGERAECKRCVCPLYKSPRQMLSW